MHNTATLELKFQMTSVIVMFGVKEVPVDF
jgi:hypothetical protein